MPRLALLPCVVLALATVRCLPAPASTEEEVSERSGRALSAAGGRCGAAAFAQPPACRQILERSDGALFVTDLSGPDVRMTSFRAPPAVKTDTVVRACGEATPPIVAISHSAGTTAIHAGGVGSGTLTTALFRPAGGLDAETESFLLRDMIDGRWSAPVAERRVDVGARNTVLDASHVVLAGSNEARVVVLVRGESGQAGVADYVLTDALFSSDGRDAGLPPRWTWLGLTMPGSSTWGNVVVASGGHAWAAFPSDFAIQVVDLGDLSAPGPLHPTLLGAVPVTAAPALRSVHVGITAAPTISFQQGDQLLLYGFDGATFRPLGAQPIAPGTAGLIEDEGIYFGRGAALWTRRPGDAAVQLLPR